jgi:hypothetical protein
MIEIYGKKKRKTNVMSKGKVDIVGSNIVVTLEQQMPWECFTGKKYFKLDKFLEKVLDFADKEIDKMRLYNAESAEKQKGAKK